MVQQPQRLWEQYAGKAHAESLRGSGWWPGQANECHLEPPWEPFDRRVVTAWDCYVNDWEASYYGGDIVRDYHEPIVLPVEHPPTHLDEQVTIRVEQFPDDDSTMALTDQLLHALQPIPRPIAFELIGRGDAAATMTQYTCHRDDYQLLDRQLSVHFPNSAVVAASAVPPIETAWPLQEAPGSMGTLLALENAYCFPLRTYSSLNPDPITVAIAAMERLDAKEWALLQVVWQPVRYDWQELLVDAITNPYRPNELFIAVEREEIRGIQEKFSAPLFAVSVRLMSSTPNVFQHLIGWSKQFSNAPVQRLTRNTNDWVDSSTTRDDRAWLDIVTSHRCTFHPGMVLNAKELACLVHLPTTNIPSERLSIVSTRTKPTVVAGQESGSVVLGENIHRGKRVRAGIPAKLRSRHCYIAGASGTGKSTLLLNMICQDILAGHGVGLLDPHGDLIKDVLARIPSERIDDVVLFDPTDREHPFALNILAAKDEEERERIVDETIMSLQRYFPASWGPRLERILTFAIKGVLDSDPSATLADVERILVNKHYRHAAIARMSNARLKLFWLDEFPKFGPSANDPVLNKLSVFLEKRVVRNIVCQRNCAIDFDEVLSRRKILLANLSTGILNESVANILGSFLVTKIVNAAFRRASIPKERRIPWYLYIDEFQNFMGVSVGFERILAEARKYELCLAGLANQYIGQLSPTVRQAIFGNIGAMIVFRLGVEDASTAAREMGVFTAEEILNLELGEAFVRTGGSKTAYNLKTYPEPPCQSDDPTRKVKARMASLTSTRSEVEAILNADELAFMDTSEMDDDGESTEIEHDVGGRTQHQETGHHKPRRRRRRKNEQSDKTESTNESHNTSSGTRDPNNWPPSDPNENDLIT